jgi:DNA-binding XRE family transcriptional regulator
VTPPQAKAARALLDWSQTDLSKAAGVALSTVYEFEKERRQTSEEAVTKMRSALERAGVVFLGKQGVKKP